MIPSTLPTGIYYGDNPSKEVDSHKCFVNHQSYHIECEYDPRNCIVFHVSDRFGFLSKITEFVLEDCDPHFIDELRVVDLENGKKLLIFKYIKNPQP